MRRAIARGAFISALAALCLPASAADGTEPAPLKLALKLAAAEQASPPEAAVAPKPAEEEARPAGKFKSRGEIALETRVFTQSGDPVTKDKALGLFGRIELQHDQGEFQQRFRGFGRVDHYDSHRSMLVVEEAYLQFRRDRLRVRFGAALVNWSATEAFHPADIINARSLDSDIENFDKLGEPMLDIQYGLTESTTLQLMLMPVYMRSIFPSASSRLNLAQPGVDLQHRARLFDRRGRETGSDVGPQAAFRVQQQIGRAEVSVHYVEHMERLMALPALDLNDGRPSLVFQTKRQFGGTYQQAFESGFLAKFEGAYNRFVQPADPVATAAAANLAFVGQPFPDRNHSAFAAGLEYTIEHGWASSTLILEGQAVTGIDKRLWPTVNLFPRNVLVGYRLAWATQDSRVLRAAAVVNVDDTAQRFYNVAYEQRLGEQYMIKAGLRIFQARNVANPVGFDALARADHVFVNLVRYF
jgi:hypothetical protein